MRFLHCVWVLMFEDLKCSDLCVFGGECFVWFLLNLLFVNNSLQCMHRQAIQHLQHGTWAHSKPRKAAKHKKEVVMLTGAFMGMAWV